MRFISVGQLPLFTTLSERKFCLLTINEFIRTYTIYYTSSVVSDLTAIANISIKFVIFIYVCLCMCIDSV